jgi:hypothetical protein
VQVWAWVFYAVEVSKGFTNKLITSASAACTARSVATRLVLTKVVAAVALLLTLLHVGVFDYWHLDWAQPTAVCSAESRGHYGRAGSAGRDCSVSIKFCIRCDDYRCVRFLVNAAAVAIAYR